MGIDFDIIDASNNLIDRISFKWLTDNWNKSFCSNYSGQSIKYIIEYCDEQITMLTDKINILQNILNIWNENDFDKRKKLKINLISNIDNEKEFYSTIEYFAEYDNDELSDCVKLSDGSKLLSDYDYYSSYKSRFVHFKYFLSKYIDYKYEISY